MIKMLNTCLMLAFFLFCSANTATALETPKEGRFDPRVRQINYNAKQVVLVNGHVGFTTHIQFAEYEEITDVAMGDPKAWSVNIKKNNLFLKPASIQDADTNMSVLTTQRTYIFDLKAYSSQLDKEGKPKAPNFYLIAFNYPEDKINFDAIEAKAKAEKDKQDAVKNRLKQDYEPDFESSRMNWNYWALGHNDIVPTQVYDNNVFTYLTFAANTPMPAIYIENKDGTESLVNTHVERVNTIVVQSVNQFLILRRGNLVAKLFNNSFTNNGVKNMTGTTVEGLKRSVKEEVKHRGK